MSQPVDAHSYLAAVITLYLELPQTPMRASLADQALARRLYKEGVSLDSVESALLLGSLRRLIRPQDAPPLSPIRSLAYFLPVIDELTANPAPRKLPRLPPPQTPAGRKNQVGGWSFFYAS